MEDKIEIKEGFILISVFEGEKEKTYKLTAKDLLEILGKLC